MKKINSEAPFINNNKWVITRIHVIGSKGYTDGFTSPIRKFDIAYRSAWCGQAIKFIVGSV